MLKAEIKSIDWNGVPVEGWRGTDMPFDGWSPENPENFGFCLSMGIGLIGEDKDSMFSIFICTRAYYADANIAEKKRIRTHKNLFVDNFKWENIRGGIQKIIDECEGRDWEEILSKLRMKFDWEYEYFNIPWPSDVN